MATTATLSSHSHVHPHSLGQTASTASAAAAAIAAATASVSSNVNNNNANNNNTDPVAGLGFKHRYIPPTDYLPVLPNSFFTSLPKSKSNPGSLAPVFQQAQTQQSIRRDHNFSKGYTMAQRPTFTSYHHPGASAVQRYRSALSERPHSIDELAEIARMALLPDAEFNDDLVLGLEFSEVYLKEAILDHELGDVEMAFVNYARTVTMVSQKIPSHPMFMKLKESHRVRCAARGDKCLAQMDLLKPLIVERYESYRIDNPQHITTTTTTTSTSNTLDIQRVLNIMQRRDDEEYEEREESYEVKMRKQRVERLMMQKRRERRSAVSAALGNLSAGLGLGYGGGGGGVSGSVNGGGGGGGGGSPPKKVKTPSPKKVVQEQQRQVQQQAQVQAQVPVPVQVQPPVPMTQSYKVSPSHSVYSSTATTSGSGHSRSQSEDYQTQLREREREKEIEREREREREQRHREEVARHRMELEKQEMRRREEAAAAEAALAAKRKAEEDEAAAVAAAATRRKIEEEREAAAAAAAVAEQLRREQLALKKKAEEEAALARKRAEEERRIEEMKRKSEEEARRRAAAAEEEERRRKEEERRLKEAAAAAEEERRIKELEARMIEEAKRRQQEEAAEARKRAEEEAAVAAAIAEAKRKAEEEAEFLRKQERQQEILRRRAEEIQEAKRREMLRDQQQLQQQQQELSAIARGIVPHRSSHSLSQSQSSSSQSQQSQSLSLSLSQSQSSSNTSSRSPSYASDLTQYTRHDGLPVLPLESPTKVVPSSDSALHSQPKQPTPQVAAVSRSGGSGKGHSASHFAPITTTSPPPKERPGYNYYGFCAFSSPTLQEAMSEHQRQQGYTPSLQSMFSPPLPAPSTSLLFAANHPEGPSSKNIPQSPDRPPAHVRHLFAMQQGQEMPARRPSPTSRIIFTDQLQKDEMEGLLGPELRIVRVPLLVIDRFLTVAAVNTAKRRETCGMLMGRFETRYNGVESKGFVVNTLLIPRQSGTSDSCTMLDEELVAEFAEKRGLIALGWIHTHPTQSCFMSSLDLHTHAAFQASLREFFAIVCSPSYHVPNCGVFRLTEIGLSTLKNCRDRNAFHPHPENIPMYTDADKGHVLWVNDSRLEIIDLR